MNEKEINDFVNGKACLVPKSNGTFAIEPILHSKSITILRFKVGQKVLCDYMNGTDGRCVAEGVIKEIKDVWYFVLQDDGLFHWRRDCELEELNEISK